MAMNDLAGTRDFDTVNLPMMARTSRAIYNSLLFVPALLVACVCALSLGCAESTPPAAPPEVEGTSSPSSSEADDELDIDLGTPVEAEDILPDDASSTESETGEN